RAIRCPNGARLNAHEFQEPSHDPQEPSRRLPAVWRSGAVLRMASLRGAIGGCVMDDRELLELAAKAAVEHVKFLNSAGDPVIGFPAFGPESCLVRIWNPLNDDGD